MQLELWGKHRLTSLFGKLCSSIFQNDIFKSQMYSFPCEKALWFLFVTPRMKSKLLALPLPLLFALPTKASLSYSGRSSASHHTGLTSPQRLPLLVLPCFCFFGTIVVICNYRLCSSICLSLLQAGCGLRAVECAFGTLGSSL